MPISKWVLFSANVNFIVTFHSSLKTHLKNALYDQSGQLSPSRFLLQAPVVCVTGSPRGHGRFLDQCSPFFLSESKLQTNSNRTTPNTSGWVVFTILIKEKKRRWWLGKHWWFDGPNRTVMMEEVVYSSEDAETHVNSIFGTRIAGIAFIL